MLFPVQGTEAVLPSGEVMPPPWIACSGELTLYFPGGSREEASGAVSGGWLIASCFILLQILEREGEENEALHKMIANEQKTSLPNLFQDKNRPCLSNWPEV